MIAYDKVITYLSLLFLLVFEHVYLVKGELGSGFRFLIVFRGLLFVGVFLDEFIELLVTF